MALVTFFLLLLAMLALVHVPPVGRWLGLLTRRDRMRGAAGLAFIVASLPHFVTPERYLPMMPAALPWPIPLIYLSGLAELAGGVGLLLPRYKVAAAWGLVVLLVAIFPANINAALTGGQAAGLPTSPWYLWLRLPFQVVFIWWVLASVHEDMMAPCPSSS